MILSGDSDALVPHHVGHRYHELLKDSELVVFEDTGHMIQSERPERVVAEIRRWTASRDPR